MTNFDYVFEDGEAVNKVSDGACKLKMHFLRSFILFIVFPWCGLLVDTQNLSISCDNVKLNDDGTINLGVSRYFFYN